MVVVVFLGGVVVLGGVGGAGVGVDGVGGSCANVRRAAGGDLVDGSRGHHPLWCLLIRLLLLGSILLPWIRWLHR